MVASHTTDHEGLLTLDGELRAVRTEREEIEAWLDHIMIVGRTIGLGDATTTAGRPAVIVSARGGYGPGAPLHGKDFLVPALETILGDPNLMALDVRTITPELTYAFTMEPFRRLLPRAVARTRRRSVTRTSTRPPAVFSRGASCAVAQGACPT